MTAASPTAAGKGIQNQPTKPPGMTGRPGDPAELRAAARAFRSRRVIPAVIVAVVLAIISALAADEVFGTMAGHPANAAALASMRRLGTDLHWNEPAVIGAAAAACAIGAILVVLALLPGRSRIVAIRTADPHTVAGVTHLGLRRCLAEAALQQDGIDRARVQLGPHRISVRAVSPLRDAPGLAAQVSQGVAASLAEFDPLQPTRIRSAVRRRED